MSQRLAFFKGLRAKFIGIFLLLMLIPMLEIVIYGYFFTGTALTEQAIARSEQEVHLQADQFVTSLSQAHGDALYLAQLRSLSMLRTLKAQNADADQIAVWRREAAQDLLAMLSAHPMYQSLRWIDASGNEIVRVQAQEQVVKATPDAELQNRADTPYFSQARELEMFSVFVSPFGSDREQDVNDPVLHYSINLGDDGVLVIDLYVDWLLRSLPKNLENDIWAIVDQAGRYLVYPSTFTPPRTDASGQARIHTELMPLLANPAGVLDLSGDVYVFNRIVPSLDTPEQFWVLYRHTPRVAMFASVNDFYVKALVFLGASMTMAVLLAVFTSGGIVSPILDLKRMAEQFGRGGAAPTVPRQLPADEIGALTRTFCEMAQELERKRQEAKLLIDRLISAQEEERKLVAYDLHDGLIQQMVGARLYLSSCRQSCPVHDGGIQRGCDALSEAIAEGRRIIEGLRPSTLDDLGLISALSDLSQRMAENSAWALSLNLQQLPIEPEKSVGVTLYRIAQEALNNARKHAEASEVSVHLSNGHGISLRVRDNGAGFDADEIERRSNGLGITTMHERAELLGGTCHIHSQRGHGTTVEVWIPPEAYPHHTPLLGGARVALETGSD